MNSCHKVESVHLCQPHYFHYYPFGQPADVRSGAELAKAELQPARILEALFYAALTHTYKARAALLGPHRSLFPHNRPAWRTYDDAPASFAFVGKRRHRSGVLASFLQSLLPLFQPAFFGVEDEIKELPGPIAVPNLSSHPEREVCSVCGRTVKCAWSLTAAGALHFIPPASQVERAHTESLRRRGGAVGVLGCRGAAFVIHRSVQHVFLC